MAFSGKKDNLENLFRPATPGREKWLSWRRCAGRIFFIIKRYLRWYLGKQRFATEKSPDLPVRLFQHASPMLRPLKNVDMQWQVNKITNLRLAAACIDGVLLQPGQTFSFWRLVGRPSARRGFLKGLTIRNGKTGVGTGGGLCQMGNLIYWMALHTPLTVTERWRHSFDVFPDENRTLPFGSGATLAYNYIDLQLKNDTRQPFQIRVFLTETHLCGEIRATEPLGIRYEVVELDHLIRQEPWGGYSRHNRLVRRTWLPDSVAPDREELVAENHALILYQPFLK